MRNVVILIAILFIVGLASSCKQNHVCECSDINGVDSFSVQLNNLRINDAKVVCDDYSDFVGQCEIK